MTTGSDILDEAIAFFMSGYADEANKLTSEAAPGATSLAMQYELGGIKAGAMIEIDEEVFRVWSTSTSSAIVEPGQDGTAQVTHPAGSIVRVNPRIRRSNTWLALQAELAGLDSTGLYVMRSLEFPYETRVGYDLTDATNVQSVWKVRQHRPGGTEDWSELGGWHHDASASTGDFPSGHALFLPVAQPGATIQVLYKAGFSQLGQPSDDIAESGLTPNLVDIVIWGIALRIGPSREIRRNFTESQGDSRRATEVTAGAISASFGLISKMREQRITQELRALNGRYEDIKP